MDLNALTTKLGGILSAGFADLLFERNPDFVDRRAYPRLKLRFKATLEIQGQKLQVRGIDLHRWGAGVNATVPLPIGALTFLFSETYGLMGWATVRWSLRIGPSQYQIGLEFRSPLMRAEAGTWNYSCVSSSHASES